MRGRRWVKLTATLLLLCGGCSSFTAYTDELNEPSSGRTPFVTAPATIGGALGFTVGVPISLVAVPITFPIYSLQDHDSLPKQDAESTLLFPSFVLWRVGLLLAVPFDMIEFSVYRVWQPPLTPSAEEQEALETELDDNLLPAYRVETIYPRGDSPDADDDTAPH